MTDASNPPITPPGGAPSTGASQAPSGGKGQVALGALFAELFTVISSLYSTVTTGDLSTLTEELNTQTQKLTYINDQIQKQSGKKCNEAELAYLKNQADQVQTQIGMLNTSLNTMSSAAASLATQLGKIVDTEKTLLSGVAGNW
ncbi:MAG: hypothetical protein AB7F31_00765 [Parachlamydiales bacterium]